MIEFTATIKQYGEQGEKTGWSYIEISPENAQQLKPGNKRSFRVKGRLDHYRYAGMALIPVGGGAFILALNAAVRKAIRKGKGATVKVQMQPDHNQVVPPAELLECLDDEPAARQFFEALAPSHRNYFIKWIESAKTDNTRAKRIAHTVTSLARGLNYAETLRSLNKDGGEPLRSLKDKRP